MIFCYNHFSSSRELVTWYNFYVRMEYSEIYREGKAMTAPKSEAKNSEDINSGKQIRSATTKDTRGTGLATIDTLSREAGAETKKYQERKDKNSKTGEKSMSSARSQENDNGEDAVIKITSDDDKSAVNTAEERNLSSLGRVVKEGLKTFKTVKIKKGKIDRG